MGSANRDVFSAGSDLRFCFLNSTGSLLTTGSWLLTSGH